MSPGGPLYFRNAFAESLGVIIQTYGLVSIRQRSTGNS